MGKKRDEREDFLVTLIPEPAREAESRKMKPTEWAQEDKIDSHLFLWYDKKEGIVSRERYNEIKARVCG
jgi:hypothetical protein